MGVTGQSPRSGTSEGCALARVRRVAVAAGPCKLDGELGHYAAVLSEAGQGREEEGCWAGWLHGLKGGEER